MRVLLLSAYELGHQPLHLAAPAAALERAGHEVRCIDLSVDELVEDDVDWAEAAAMSVPMHTALRLARATRAELRARRPDLPICLYGLYAAVDDGAEQAGSLDVAVAGEYEAGVVGWVDGLAAGRAPGGARVQVVLERQAAGLPARRGLPPLERYARLVVGGEQRLAGYVEASHGCAHRCRHCPVPVVYDGRTRVVAVEAVLADVAQLVGLGARHITFGDPDFLNGPHHARRVVTAVHDAFPELTFDITAKVEHVLAHRELWPDLAGRGLVFVVTAVESASDAILARLSKGHSAADTEQAVRLLRAAGVEPRPSLLPFTPWTTAADVVALLDQVARLDLIGNVDPVQYAIRLLVPPGSLLLDSGDLDGLLGPYDPERLGWSWQSADPRLDELQARLEELAAAVPEGDWDPAAHYAAVRATTAVLLGTEAVGPAPPVSAGLASPLPLADRPRLTEAWFCCAEPTGRQLAGVRAGTHIPEPTGGR